MSLCWRGHVRIPDLAISPTCGQDAPRNMHSWPAAAQARAGAHSGCAVSIRPPPAPVNMSSRPAKRSAGPSRQQGLQTTGALQGNPGSITDWSQQNQCAMPESAPDVLMLTTADLQCEKEEDKSPAAAVARRGPLVAWLQSSNACYPPWLDHRRQKP